MYNERSETLKKIKKRFLFTLIAIIALVFFFYFQNNSIVITESTISSKRIPASFNDYKIVQLSDLHSKTFGNRQNVLVEKVSNTNPDLIVFTGDLVDSKNYNEDTSLNLIRELIHIAPIYFVTGNHEWWSGKFDILEKELNDIGVKVLRNTNDVISKGHEKIQIIGIDDPAYVNDSYTERSITEGAIENSVEGMEDDYFKILLSHRPEFLSIYSKYGIDVVFSGHAHGGQVRIPFVGGLVAPNQGFLPKYTAGKYDLDNTSMFVNRGLGNSTIPLRIFNRPEIIVLTLSRS
ncbi:phosphoesterase [Terribacillus saccharophilus]|uniref:Phosphoesterase n=1 Tax=Terribacillus saccharophilus TaxID=361277 RepID=A0ABX4GVN2_9BACI|nr:phosphoesterase [Terribacillus saccharophilus]PAD95355.1 phosphoesterase [Terribacillus saccharophilus]PAD98933.1 phosphoesterase [Terribacillus saccharophilus]